MTMPKFELTQARLKEVLSYDQESGLFSWKIRTSSKIKIGSIAGNKTSHGYIRITIDGNEYRAHRLVWLYVFGKFPDGDIDHINGNKTHNSIANLRDVTHVDNQQNQRAAHSRNKTGFLGVSKRGNRYRTSIMANGVVVDLGTYATPEDAHAAYTTAKRELHPTCTI